MGGRCIDLMLTDEAILTRILRKGCLPLSRSGASGQELGSS